MSINTKIALAVALALGTTSAALAQGTSHRHHASASMRHVVTNTFAFDAGNSARIRLEPPGGLIQDRDYRSSNGFSPLDIW